MSFSQWTKARSSTAVGALDFDLDSVDQIEGTSSLRSRANGVISHGVMGLTSSAAISTGRIRTLIKRDDDTNGPTQTGSAWGIFGMMQSSIAVSSQAYWAVFRNNDSIRLLKAPVSNIDAATPLATALHGLGIFNTGNVWALELKWQRDADTGSIILTVSVGLTSFSNLSTKITHTDSSSPFSSGVSSGIGAQTQSGSQEHIDLSWDETEIYRV